MPITRDELGRRVLNVVKRAEGNILRGKGIARNAEEYSDGEDFF